MNTRRMAAILTTLGLFLFTNMVAPEVQAAPYSFTTFDAPGTVDTYPASINASGQVAGYYSDGSRHHGFIYSNGVFTALDGPGATYTEATSINDSGQVVGNYSESPSSAVHGFMYSNGSFTTLDRPGAFRTRVYSINAGGQVVGNYEGRYSAPGFVYSNGTFTILGGLSADSVYPTSINVSGQVTGYYYQNGPDGPGAHGFLYTNGILGTVTKFNASGAIGTYPTSINANGQVTGSYLDSSYHGFLYSDGTFTILNVPSAIGTVARSINESGQVTGVYWDNSRSHGFVYSNGTFTTLDVPGSIGTYPTSINANGQVTGTYQDNSSRKHGFIATPVCATPTVTIHTLTTVSHVGLRITGSITLGGDPLCALVLANGQFLFTCGDPLPKGNFDLTVPVDDQGQITLFGFSSGLAPFQQTLGPGALPASVNATRCATPKVTYTTAAAPEGRAISEK